MVGGFVDVPSAWNMAILDDGWAIGREVIYIHVDGAYVTIIIIATTVKSIR